MSFPLLTLTNIILGLTGALIGSFPSVYLKTVGKLGNQNTLYRIWARLILFKELTDQRMISKLLSGLGVSDPKVVKLKVETGLNLGKDAAMTAWISQWDSTDKPLPNSLNVEAISRFFHDRSDRNKNRWAFGIIALAYSFQILGLLLGTT